MQAAAVVGAAAINDICSGIKNNDGSALASGVQACPPANVSAASTAMAQAAAKPETVQPVASALGSACAAGQDTSAYAEAVVSVIC